MIVLDIDGTLLDSNGTLRPRVKEAVQLAREKGVEVALATGRRWRTALPIALQLGIRLPLILHNGATIQEVSSGRIITYSCIPVALAREAIVSARETGLGGLFLYEHPLKGERIYFENMQRKGGGYRGWIRSTDSFLSAANLLDICLEDPLRLVAVDEVVTGRAWEERIRSSGSNLSCLSGGDLIEGSWVVEVFADGVSKGNALRELARRLGIDRRHILAVGDWDNDLEMIEFAGLGVAMGNAPERVRNAAAKVTTSNDEDGVAGVIEEHVLGVAG